MKTACSRCCGGATRRLVLDRGVEERSLRGRANVWRYDPATQRDPRRLGGTPFCRTRRREGRIATSDETVRRSDRDSIRRQYMEAIIERACGLDVHQAQVTACLLVGGAGQRVKREVRKFGTFT